MTGKLKPLDIERETRPGKYADGDGLYLIVASASSKNWSYRYWIGGKERWHGLGSFKDVSLKDARLARDAARRPYTRRERNMHTFVFRSYSAILEADEADLIRDVGLDLHKAQVKLRKITERLQGVQEQAAAQIEQLTVAQTKLSAAIVAALLSNRREG